MFCRVFLAIALFCIFIVRPSVVSGADFAERKLFWESNAFKCKFETGDFPSKEGDTPGSCDDGDMTLFNGLLCLAGQEVGCEAVRRSQAKDGRWWRSPRRINWEAPKHDVSFSADQALGVFSYLVATRDVRSFEAWVRWIDQNRPCITSIGDTCIKGWPRYCRDDHEDKRCTLRPADCAWFSAIGDYLSRPVHVCPSVLDVSTFVAGSTTLNTSGFPLHLAAVQLLLLRRLGILNENAKIASETFKIRGDENNAFFQYLRFGNTDKVAELTLRLCPSPERPSRRRFQWSWERADGEQAWLDSMYWDCIFLASLMGR